MYWIAGVPNKLVTQSILLHLCVIKKENEICIQRTCITTVGMQYGIPKSTCIGAFSNLLLALVLVDILENLILKISTLTNHRYPPPLLLSTISTFLVVTVLFLVLSFLLLFLFLLISCLLSCSVLMAVKRE